jgi:hypothetical protein
MENKWYTNFREAIHCANEFFKERQDGQIPPDIRAHRTFMEYVLNHNPIEAIRAELIRSVADPNLKKHMLKGLMTKTGDIHNPGDAFRSSHFVIRVACETGACELRIQPLIHFINEYPYNPKQSSVQDPKKVNTYVVKLLALSILELIGQLKEGEEYIVTNREKNTISGMTEPNLPKNIETPYNQYNIGVLQDIIEDAANDEYVRGYAEEQGYSGFLDTVKRNVKTFSAAKVGSLSRVTAEVVAKRSIKPVISIVKEFGQRATIGASNEGHIDSCDQD